MAETSNRKTYHEQTYIDNTLRLREILKTLPPFAKDYFRAVEPTTSARTRISYAYDIRVFFHFLMENNPVYKNYTIEQFEVHDLERLEPVDIEEYQEYLKVYKNDEEKCITNTEKGLARKMSALRSFYGYYFKRQIISKNPTLLVEMPKMHEKAIIRLDTDEIAMLLDYVDHGGDNLTGQRKAYFEKTKNRDLAILTLLLGTGIRVSECVGLDLQDIDFKNNRINVDHQLQRTRDMHYIIEDTKTACGVRMIPMTPEVKECFERIIGNRPKPNVEPMIDGRSGFLFLDKNEMPMVALHWEKYFQHVVEKYNRIYRVQLPKITPHVCRHTYCSNMAKAGMNPKTLQYFMGHSDIGVTLNTYTHFKFEDAQAEVLLMDESCRKKSF